MKAIRFFSVLMICGLFYSNNLTAQQEVLDGIYVKEHHPAKRVIPYTPLREADVMWLKRIWRVLDLREKINHPLYYPTEKIMDRQSMTQLIYESVINPDAPATITHYDVMDDEFTIRMTSAEVEQKTTKIDTEYVENEMGDLEPLPIKEEFSPHAVKRYRMKEEWFFDNQKSVMEPRIIGMCPVQEKFDEMGEYKGEMPLFWLYFPEARIAFSTVPVYNEHNDAERRTLEDLFWKRKFASYIYKESSVYDRKIDTYKQDLDLLLESKRIEHDIFQFEQELWEY